MVINFHTFIFLWILTAAHPSAPGHRSVVTAAHAAHFNCDELKGTYECNGKNNHEIIEMHGQQITVIDDTEMPLSFKVNAGPLAETSSEKQHVSYTSSCDKKKGIEIRKTIVFKDGGDTAKETMTFTPGGLANLEMHTVTKGPASDAVRGSVCMLIKADQ